MNTEEHGKPGKFFSLEMKAVMLIGASMTPYGEVFSLTCYWGMCRVKNSVMIAAGGLLQEE